MIKTMEQAHAAIAEIETQDRVTSEDQSKANRIAQAIDAAKIYDEMTRSVERFNARGDIAMRDQAVRQREEYVATRMTDLGKRLAGIA